MSRSEGSPLNVATLKILVLIKVKLNILKYGMPFVHHYIQEL